MALPDAAKKQAVTFEVILNLLHEQDAWMHRFIFQPGGAVCHHLCSAPEPVCATVQCAALLPKHRTSWVIHFALCKNVIKLHHTDKY